MTERQEANGERYEDLNAQLEQIADDGPLQDSQNALLKVGTECVFTFGPDQNGHQEVYLSKVTRITPEGRPVLMVFEDYQGRFRPSLRQDAYFSSAKPGTPLAARCWGWPEGGVRTKE